MYESFNLPPDKSRFRRFVDTLYSYGVSVYIRLANRAGTSRYPWDSNQMWTLREMARLTKQVGATNLLKTAKDSDLPYELRQALTKYKK